MKSGYFESLLSFLIITNVSLLLAEHFPQSDQFTDAVNTANLVYLVLFTIEILLEVLATSLVEYWASNWSKVDVFVVAMSWFFTALEVQVGVQGARAIRFLRIIILFKHSGTIRRMVFTLIAAIAPSVNVMAAMFLTLFIYAIIGMQFYGNLEHIEGTKINELDNFSDMISSMRLLVQLATGQDLKSLIYDVQQQGGAGIVTYIISFYVVVIFVFMNLFVAVLLEAFEREFDESIQVDVSVDDLTSLKDRWDKFCRELVHAGKVEPRVNCGRKVLTDLPVLHIRDFVESIPEESKMAACRQLGESWLNRLLVENLPDGIDPTACHEAWQGTGPTDVLDNVMLDFPRVAESLALMRSTVTQGGDSGLAGLSYGDKLKKEKLLIEKRTAAALEMLRVQVRAWKALRSPSLEFVEELENDPSYRAVYCRQVEIARVLMMCTIINRTKVV
eukprot:SAG31_NODE_3054_length_4739_cov_2.395690_2_plen_446_part_00